MPERAEIRSPLLKGAVGSRSTDFRIFENLEPPAATPTPTWVAPLHRHAGEDEGWYVLEGVLRFRFGQEEFDAPAGSGVLLPHGIAHTFGNPGSTPARYLLIARPKTVALLEELHGGSDRTRGHLVDLFRRHDVELIG